MTVNSRAGIALLRIPARTSLLTIACVACVVALPSPAMAAPIRECGDMSTAFAYNITTRVVSCREARRVVRGWNRGPAQRGGNGRVRGLYCRYRDTGYEAGDIRCTGSSGRVVRWQTYS